MPVVNETSLQRVREWWVSVGKKSGSGPARPRGKVVAVLLRRVSMVSVRWRESSVSLSLEELVVVSSPRFFGVSFTSELDLSDMLNCCT